MGGQDITKSQTIFSNNILLDSGAHSQHVLNNSKVFVSMQCIFYSLQTIQCKVSGCNNFTTRHNLPLLVVDGDGPLLFGRN